MEHCNANTVLTFLKTSNVASRTVQTVLFPYIDTMCQAISLKNFFGICKGLNKCNLVQCSVKHSQPYTVAFTDGGRFFKKTHHLNLLI